MRISHVTITRLLAQSSTRGSTFARTLRIPRSASRWSSTDARQWSTPLAKQLAEAITTTGPIPLADYMRQCLTNPDVGYYSTRTSDAGDQFGRRGDFVTSPEISQIFGELVGVWFVAEWIAQGKKNSGLELIELGPGRGTLMDDVLRTIANFKPMASAIEKIYLVESSKALRDQQKDLLCGDAPMLEHEEGYTSTSKRLPQVPIIWIEDINFKAKDGSKHPFIVAHEFFDALPLYAFQSAPKSRAPDRGSQVAGITTSTAPGRSPLSLGTNEWRELLVSPTPPPSIINPPREPPPEFELSLSISPTRYSRLLPNISPRYKKLLATTGATIEVSAEARTITTVLAQMIGGAPSDAPNAAALQKSEPSGAALVIDYGPSDSVPISSLRGISKHERCSPFSSPGRVDISADVDFSALVEAALSSSEAVEVHGPVEQADWLRAMGGTERSKALIRNAKKSDDKGSDEVADRITTGWTRLVDRGPNGMGRIYKAMAILPLTNGKRRPVGFGGDITL